MNRIILLDGPKGAGKSTLARLLQAKLSNTNVLSLDQLRRSIPGAQANALYNKRAFELLLKLLKSEIQNGTDVIIDCGLTQANLAKLEEFIKGIGGNFYKYSLSAPYEILLERVKRREELKGKETDIARFDYLIDVLTSKSFDTYTHIDTSQMTTEDIAKKILADLT